MENSYTIQQIEILSDIKAHTLRIWEKRYNIIEPKRSEGNFRYYDENDLKKILNIAYLNKNGIKISKIAQLEEEELNSYVLELFESKKTNIESFQVLTNALIDYNLPLFESFFEDYLKRNDFETCLINIIYPFFDRIGILWQTNKICPAQEHLFSQYMKQLVLSQLNNVKPKAGGKRVLIYLRENEYHELGTLVYHYLLRKRGYDVYNLGQSVPLESLIESLKKLNPEIILTSFVAFINEEVLSVYFENLTPFIKDADLYVTGNIELLDKEKAKYNYHVLKNLDEFNRLF